MTVEEYYAAVVAQLTAINSQLMEIAADISGISTAMTDGMALLMEIIIVAGLLALAYWKNDSILYLISAMTLIVIGWQWEWQIMLPLILLAVYTAYRAIRPWLPW